MPRLERMSEGRAHLIDDRAPVGSTPVAGGQTLGVTGSTGAPGRTFLSINLAFAIRALGKKVVLVDADPHLGAVAVQLDLAEDRSLTYLAHEATLKRIDDTLVLRHLQSISGVDVLTGRAIAGLGDVVSETLLTEVVQLLRRRYDVVVVDVGALDCRDSQHAALLCQLLIWVVVPTKVGADLLDRTLSGPLAGQVRTRPSLVVLNRLGGPTLRDVDTSLRRRYGMAVAGAVADHRRACLDAEDTAHPAAEGGPLAGSIRRLAKTVIAALAKSGSASQSASSPVTPDGPLPLASEVMRWQ
jgi:MinD-like ATPase involved in chromosome partitioning or flagellar assembly